jgi:hypothetical protein
MPANNNHINYLITSNLYGLYEFIGVRKGCVLHKGNIVDWVITKPSCWPNMIFNTRINNPDQANEIKEITGYIRGKKTPPFWIITPETDGVVESILEDNGLIAIDLMTGMAIDLIDFRKKYEDKGNSTGLDITEVASESQMLQWIEIVNKVIFKGKKLDQELFTGLPGNSSIHFYIGNIKDNPVATSMSFISPHSAGFYSIATLPEFRKRGFATAMTAYAMNEAVNKGFKTGILHASVMGEPVYLQMGFKAFGKFKVFWMAGKEFRDY